MQAKANKKDQDHLFIWTNTHPSSHKHTNAQTYIDTYYSKAVKKEKLRWIKRKHWKLDVKHTYILEISYKIYFETKKSVHN